MSLSCHQDDRRNTVRRTEGRNGLDYVEVSSDQLTLTVFFLGKLPPEFTEEKPPLADGTPYLARYLQLTGGERVKNIRITQIEAAVDPDPEMDDQLVLTLDKYGDFSAYTLRLTGVAHIDPHYDRVEFTFKIDCPSDLDCAPTCRCEPPALNEPEINYLAKDYASFRQLILDRLSLLVPDWTERHVPDVGLTLVEALAYTGDYLSYFQDAVATEAYLATARQRISVRRHARLVDYHLHEGCNARTWVCLGTDTDFPLDLSEVSFVTNPGGATLANRTILSWDDLRGIATAAYEAFQPMPLRAVTPFSCLAAHSEIDFYTWGGKACCLERGSTTATLLDGWQEETPTPEPGPAPEPIPEPPPTPNRPTSSRKDAVKGWSPVSTPAIEDPRARRSVGMETDAHPTAPSRPKAANPVRERKLRLQPGDVLIFEEVIGPITGNPADADPARRHAVRLTKVTPGEDKLYRQPVVEIEWAAADALPVSFCLSAIGAAPACRYLERISVARGNVLLVDHGRSVGPEDLGEVPTLRTEAKCECAGRPGDMQFVAGKFNPRLAKVPLTFRAPLPPDDPAAACWQSAASLLRQDVRTAMPDLKLESQPEQAWASRYDLIASGPTDRHFAVELDDDQVAHLRFGNGDLGFAPSAGTTFSARYRVGNGASGNVGPESILKLVLEKTRLDGVVVTVRNPLAAQGGTDAEPVVEARLFAPHAFRDPARIQRAIVADDYRLLAEQNPGVQRAAAALVWTGSWYEVDVAVDPLGRERSKMALLDRVGAQLARFRRIGHDVHVKRAHYVPLDLKLKVCVQPHYQRSHVKAALLEVFGSRALSGGRRGFFHPDSLTFGEGIFLSKIIATAQSVPGVASVTVPRFQRLFEAPAGELEAGVLALRLDEIPQLDNDPNWPEHGKLEIETRGGR